MGGRTNAESIATTTTGDRQRAQTAYDTAEKKLAKLPEARSVGELEPLLASAKPVCRVYTTKGNRQTVCTKPPALEAEFGRARERVKLQAAMDKASEELKTLGAPKAANSDAVALETYLRGLGIEATADRINKLLVLLAVLVIECGGGLALAVAMSLSGQGGHVPDTRTTTRTESPPDTRTDAPDTLAETLFSKGVACPLAPDTANLPAPDTIDKSAAGVRFLAFLAERGGVLVSGQREMGRALGWSKSWTHEVLHDLAGARLVDLHTGKTGTVVRLNARAA